jgi:hypothetical protein
MKQSTRRVYGLWEKDRKALLPYGIWRCADGSELLFNRRYEVIHARDRRGKPLSIEPNSRVEWAEQKWYYTDVTPPFDKIRAGLAALAAWGIAAPKGWMKAYAPTAAPQR